MVKNDYKTRYLLSNPFLIFRNIVLLNVLLHPPQTRCTLTPPPLTPGVVFENEVLLKRSQATLTPPVHAPQLVVLMRSGEARIDSVYDHNKTQTQDAGDH